MSYSALQPASANSPRDSSPLDEARYRRLRSTATLAGEAFDRWQGATVGIVGLGTLGSRLAPEIVRAGARVWCCDLDHGSEENLGTQLVEPGRTKVSAVLDACQSLREGRAAGLVEDVRHVGIGVLNECDVLVDATDDAGLGWPLTEISNGLGKPLVRLAVDGSGQREFGRVLVSHGGGEHACQLCSFDMRALLGRTARTPCPGQQPARPAATAAGSAIAMAVVGVGLLQIERLAGGRCREQAWDREVLVDLDGMSAQAFRLERSADCLSGHVRWQWTTLESHACETAWQELLERARDDLGTREVTLEPYGHPLCLKVACPACGAGRFAVGTRWAPAGACERCGTALVWQTELALPRVGEVEARRLRILTTPVAHLGLPERAMVVAHAAGASRRYVLA